MLFFQEPILKGQFPEGSTLWSTMNRKLDVIISIVMSYRIIVCKVARFIINVASYLGAHQTPQLTTETN